MSTFLNISRQEAKRAHLLVFQNAMALKRDAFLLARVNNSYSSATSLLILSCEEIVKAILLCLHAEGYDIHKLKDAKRFYANHEIRHQIVQLLEIGASIYESTKKYEETYENIKFSYNSKYWNNLINALNIAAEIAGVAIKETDKLILLQNFNNLKNAGFYTDYKDKIQLPRKEITLSDFESIKEIAGVLKRHYKHLRILHSTNISRLIPNNESKTLKLLLKKFINDKMVDFDFKILNSNL